MMQNKSMDFFRPTRPTDPLVDRPKIKSVSAPIKRPRVNPASVQPTLKSGSGIASKSQFSRPSVAGSTVSLKKTIVKKSTPSSTTTSVTSTATVSSTVKAPNPVRKPAPKLPPKPAPVPKRKTEEDDWLDSLEKSGFLTEDEKPKGKISYPFGGESPFLKSVKVEKRPLSDSVPERSPYDRPDFGKKKPAPRKDPVRIMNKSKKKSNALSLTLIIIVTVILGIAAGVGVFFLIAG